MEYRNEGVERIVNLLNNRTQNNNKDFFRSIVCYFLAKMAASMRASINTKDRGNIPVNLYSINLATSGFGKGHSISILENEIFNGFQELFEESTLPYIAHQNIKKIADYQAELRNADAEEVLDKLLIEYETGGVIPFTFDSGTIPAIKQLRHKLLLGSIGSMNIQIDEIGSNLTANTDILNAFLELYDQGKIKTKLIKNTAENTRTKEINGKTPTNMLLFGTPSKLLDGCETEAAFFSFLEAGYARRCFFAMGEAEVNTSTPEEIFYNLINPKNTELVEELNKYFSSLAHPDMYNWKMTMEDTVAIDLIRYKLQCEALANDLPAYLEIQKAELSHRYFKVLKLAGALAFTAKSKEITHKYLNEAIQIAEDSGKAFSVIIKQEKPYVRLAKFIESYKGSELTHADISEALPFYKSSTTLRNELLTLATAWGYTRHILIKRNTVDNVELISGESLQSASLESCLVSYSKDWATGYVLENPSFAQLPKLLTADDLHWANHAFAEGHRSEATVIKGFNLVVLDIDNGNLDNVKELLKDYEFMTCTTKRHTNNVHRFRLIFPINYMLKMEKEDYALFMEALCNWLPFTVDVGANQRSRKWQTNPNGLVYHNRGNVLDVTQFIPRTSRYAEARASTKKVASFDNLERWFLADIDAKGRNNQILRYALMLADSGYSEDEVKSKVLALNSKISNGLSKMELESTIFKTLSKKVIKESLEDSHCPDEDDYSEPVDSFEDYEDDIPF